MSPFERLDNDTRSEWMGHPATVAFLETIKTVREQVATGLVESIKAGTIMEHTMFVVGGELRALDQLLTIALRKAPPRG